MAYRTTHLDPKPSFNAFFVKCMSVFTPYIDYSCVYTHVLRTNGTSFPRSPDFHLQTRYDVFRPCEKAGIEKRDSHQEHTGSAQTRGEECNCRHQDCKVGEKKVAEDNTAQDWSCCEAVTASPQP